MGKNFFRLCISCVLLFVLCAPFISSPLYSSNKHYGNDRISFGNEEDGSPSPRERPRSETIDGSSKQIREKGNRLNSTKSFSTAQLPELGSKDTKRTFSFKNIISPPRSLKKSSECDNIKMHQNELLHLSVATMDERAFNNYWKINKKKALEDVKSAISSTEHLTNFLKHSNWGVKLACDPHIALQVLNDSDICKLKQEDTQNFGHLISAVFTQAETRRKLLGLRHITVAMLSKYFPSFNTQNIEHDIWKIAKPAEWPKQVEKIEELAPYWKAYNVLVERRSHHTEGYYLDLPLRNLKTLSCINHSIDVETILSAFDENEYIEILTFFHSMGVSRSADTLHSRGISHLYLSPGKGIKWLERAGEFGRKDSYKALGMYYWRMDDYNNAKKYLSQLPNENLILGAIAEQDEGKRVAVNNYKKAALHQPLAILRWRQLESDHQSNFLTHAKATLEAHIEKFEKMGGESEDIAENLKAALIAIYLREFTKAHIWVDRSSLTEYNNQFPEIYEQHLWAAYIHTILGNYDNTQDSEKVKEKHLEQANDYLTRVKYWAVTTIKNDPLLTKLSLKPFGLQSFPLKYLSETSVEVIQQELLEYYQREWATNS